MWLFTVQAPQRPVFSARVDLVVVDVTVTRSDGAPVTNLRASDFRLLDRGVPQAAELVEAAPVPLDLSVVLDTSGSTRGQETHFWETIRTLAGLLRPGDRIGLTTFGRTVNLAFPLQAASAPIADEPAWEGVGSPVTDALFDAVAQPGEKGRRHVILAMTDGGDIGSILSPEQLSTAAATSDATIYIGFARHAAFRGVPFVPPALERTFNAICQTTGGAVLNGQGDDIVKTFRRVIALMDESYLLTYVARDVSFEGWHAIDVKVVGPESAKYRVHARRGYFGG